MSGRSNSGSKDGRFKSAGMKKIAKNANRNQSKGGSRSSTQQSISQFITKEQADKIQGICRVFGQTSAAKGSRSIGRKNKHEESDSDFEEERKKRMATPKSGTPKRGKVANSTENVLKQMKETGESLKKLSKYSNNDGVEIANSLEDLGSTDDENNGSTADNELTDNGLGSCIDAYLDSTPMKRAMAENEWRISDDCPLYLHIGTLDQVFRLKKPEDLPKESHHTFEAIFLAPLGSKWRTSLIEQFKVESKNGIKMDFNNFMVVFCYVFQLRPSQIGVGLDGLKMEEEMQMNRLEQMARELDEGELRAKKETTKENIISKNIDTFFELWNCLDFFKCWKEAEIIALLRAFCYIYLDQGMINDREKVELAIANFFDKLVGDESSENNQKLDNILFKFGHRGILQCAQDHWNRVICLFALFRRTKFVQFKARHRLSTTYALLQYVISGKIYDDKEKPSPRECTLGQVFQLLPKAIECLKKRNDATALNCVYTKLMDGLTEDEQMLNDESDESLSQASENFNATCASLNKRDINQKMVDMWSDSGHRIRQIIQDRRRNAAIFENEKAEAKKTNKYYFGGLGSSSSSEEEDE